MGKAGIYAVAEHRAQIEVIGDILSTASDQTEEGAGVTSLIRNANVPHARISGMLGTLVSRGLLERSAGGGRARYRISMSGRQFLREYRAFREFADSFGLSI